MTDPRLGAVTLPLDATAVRSRGLQRAEHRLVLVTGDAAAASAAVALALWAWSLTTGFPFDGEFLRRWAAFVVLVPVWTALLSGSRRPAAALSIQATFASLVRAGGILLALYVASYFYAPPRSLPRLPAMYFLWEAVLLTLGWRIVYMGVFTAPGLRRRAIIVGTGPAAARILDALRAVSPDVTVVAAVDTSASDSSFDLRLSQAGIPLCQPVELPRLIVDSGASEIVIAANTLPPDLVHDLLGWQERGIAVVPMAAEYEHLLMRVPVRDVPPAWLFTSLSEWVRSHDASNVLKRLVDIVGAAAGLIVFALTLPFIAVLIWADTGRPVFYTQVRLGGGGRTFRLLKYRTMHADAEQLGPRWADEDDARITRAGRWLRRSRLDELPQFLNVLRGEMSLVGPRPERPEFGATLERDIPLYRARLMVRPGLTGWAQVNSDYAASAEDATLKLEYDLYYVKHRSFMFDAWILLRTASTMLAFRGR